MSAEIGYSGGEGFSWRSHWHQWRKVWCHLRGHRQLETKIYTLSYFAKVNGSDWHHVQDTTPVEHCGFCNTVLKYDVRIKADSLEKKIAHVQLTALTALGNRQLQLEGQP